MTATPLRNAPCPCGSGRRYKECHGALGAPAVPADTGIARRNTMLAAALAAQEAGDIAAAISGYRSVLAEAPDHFDALHMLGVAMLQTNQIQEAESLIARAVSLRPDILAAQSNLAIARNSGAFIADETRICRAVLPRLARLCVDPPSPLLDGVGSGDVVEVLFAGTAVDAGLAQSIANAAVARGAVVSAATIAVPGPPGWPLADDARLANLDGATVVVVGLMASIGDWPVTARPRSTSLVVTHDAPCPLHDRLRELSGQGRRQVSLAIPDVALAATTPLPMHPFTLPEGG